MKSARLIAFEVLYRIFTDGAYSNIILDSMLKDTKDRQFISALVYGVVERKLTVDYFIDKYSAGKRVKPKIRIILEMGIYQLLFMDKIPDSAAVNESVKLAGEIRQDFYSGFINALLHKVAEDRTIPAVPWIKYSVSENLIHMWNKQYGESRVNAFLPCINDRPPIFAVPNTLYVDADALLYALQCENIDCEVSGEIVKINSSFDLNKSKSFKNGLFYIEDMSSYHCAKRLGAQPGETILDMCAAPGGKSFAIALDMKNQGRLYSFDLYEQRAELIKKSAQRLGIDIIKTEVNDAAVYNESIPCADRILCDVPCSGFGVIRRKPEIRYKELDSVKELPALQLKILETSSKYLKQGGRLIYSTCTLNKKENEKVVSAFLNANSDFSLTEEKTVFPSADGGDGFYYALMVKNENGH